MITKEEFTKWLAKHRLNRFKFATQLIGMPSSVQVTMWFKKDAIPQWVDAYTKLYDEHKALKDKYEPVVDPGPQEPLLLPGEEPPQEESSLVESCLPELTGSQTSRCEAEPMRRRIVSEVTSPTWWVKVFKENFLTR